MRDFNSHTREGVTMTRYDCRVIFCNFNSHTREGVTRVLAVMRDAVNFNSHTREGVTIYAE